MCPFSFMHGMSWRHGVYDQWKKIKDKEVRLAILDGLHKVMYMSINPYENIEAFKDCGRKKVVESFEWHKFGESWTQYFWVLLLSIWYVNALSLLGFCYWISYICNYFHSLNYFENNPTYILSCIMCVVVELWMIGLWQLLHSNQDTQVSIESYHGASKC